MTQYSKISPFGGGGGSASPITTRGDLIVGDVSGAESRLAIGTSGQVLTSDGTDASWATPSATIDISSQTSNFIAADGKTYLVSSAAARAITLPAAAANIQFWIKDSTGSCSTNNFTITRASTEEIDGVAANRVLQTDWGSWHFVCDGTNWFIL